MPSTFTPRSQLLFILAVDSIEKQFSGSPCALLVGLSTGVVNMENRTAFLKNGEWRLPYDSEISLPELEPPAMRTWLSHGAFLSHEREGDPAICTDTDEHRGHYAKWDKWGSWERQISHNFTDMWNWEEKEKALRLKKMTKFAVTRGGMGMRAQDGGGQRYKLPAVGEARARDIINAHQCDSS